MKVFYETYSGHTYCEDIDPEYRQIELADGFHFITPGSVWRDVEHRNDAIFLCRQGIAAPEGSGLVREQIYQSQRLKLHKANIGVSKMFWRHLATLFVKLFYAGAVIMTATSVGVVFAVFIYLWTR